MSAAWKTSARFGQDLGALGACNRRPERRPRCPPPLPRRPRSPLSAGSESPPEPGPRAARPDRSLEVLRSSSTVLQDRIRGFHDQQTQFSSLTFSAPRFLASGHGGYALTARNIVRKTPSGTKRPVSPAGERLTCMTLHKARPVIASETEILPPISEKVHVMSDRRERFKRRSKSQIDETRIRSARLLPSTGRGSRLAVLAIFHYSFPIMMVHWEGVPIQWQLGCPCLSLRVK